MSSLIFWVPGFAGSQLLRADDTDNEIWVSYISLGLQHFVYLRLAEDGIQPGEPDGIQLVAGAPLDKFYGTAMGELDSQLQGEAYGSYFFGYDFRKDIVLNGMALADAIRVRDPNYDPFTIIAHSTGGLVARFAWRDLGRTNEQWRVRRIITLGTPHQGTYQPIMLASGRHDTLDQLYGITNLFPQGTAFVPKAGKGVRPTKIFKEVSYDQLIAIILTWPGIYALWPQLGGDDAMGDPDRELLYLRDRWHSESQPVTRWLDRQSDVLAPLLRDPSTLPPPHILTTVAGDNLPTRWGLTDPLKLGFPDAIGSTTDGDGTVSTNSALILQSAQYTLTCYHMDLPLSLVQSGDLKKWILAVRNPPDPVPEKVELPLVVAKTLADPPFAAGLSYGAGAGPGGDC